MRAEKTNVVWTGPSSVGPLLLQEQPHPIVYAELAYRWAGSAARRKAVLRQWARIVDSTATFMASFALRAKGFPTRGCLNLGPPMLPGMGVEGGDPGNEMNYSHTLNSVYENTYWRWALELAQRWRERRAGGTRCQRARRSAPAAASSARTARPSPAVRERWRARRPMMPPRALGRGRCRRSRARRAQTGARCGFGA